MMTDGNRDSWIEAGFKELARSGVEGVRVEVLAKHLGVTKGGFYRRFRDRAALLEAMLESWRKGGIRRRGVPFGPERRCRDAEDRRPALSRHGPCGGRGRRGGLPVLLLHLR